MIIDWNKIEARAGDPVLPAWDAMKRAVRSLRLIQGGGVRLAYGAEGTAISAEDGGASFSHPFTVSVSGNGVTVSKGLVGNIEPVINGAPVSGDANSGQGQPTLAISAGQMDAATLQSWVCVEVRPKGDGTLDPNAPPTITHGAMPTSTDPTVGRCPLALLLWASNGAAGPSQVYQVTYFNLRYERTNPGAGQGVAQHFFL